MRKNERLQKQENLSFTPLTNHRNSREIDASHNQAHTKQNKRSLLLTHTAREWGRGTSEARSTACLKTEKKLFGKAIETKLVNSEPSASSTICRTRHIPMSNPSEGEVRDSKTSITLDGRMDAISANNSAHVAR